MEKPIYVKEYKEIENVLVNYYGKGGKEAKSEIMKPGFHEKAEMFSIDEKGKLVGEPVGESLFPVIDNHFRPSPEAEAVIVYIDINGTAASARVDTNDLSGFCFTDYFNLLKVEGKWLIVNKIFHTNYAE
ncbi:nuclear transport factor 2 family protein [Fusobacterium nucleatum]|uniref:nuclear transport factor 2 family protein n=1 Tax=Fusobacterium nucleatum TaxID=851 RepID=UPI0003FD1436|nr:nuclear transport factor 2 family protein [Fusobacterium nucleatum]